MSDAAARRRRSRRLAVLLTVLLGASPSVRRAPASPPPRVQARFEVDAARASPFPADWLTVPDRAQRTGLRVAGPGPAVRARAVRVRRLAAPRRVGRLRPRAPSRPSLHGGDRPQQCDRAQRLPDPPRRGAGRDHRRGPPRLGSRLLYPLRPSRHRPRAGDPLWPRRDARPARLRQAAPSSHRPASCRPALGGRPVVLREHRAAPSCCARPSSGGASGPTASRPPPSSPPGACRRSSSKLATRSIGGRPRRRS